MSKIKNEKDTCPHCDNEYEISKYFPDNGYYEISCPFCGFEGKEYWTLQFSHITDLDDKEIIGWTGGDSCQYCGKAGGH